MTENTHKQSVQGVKMVDLKGQYYRIKGEVDKAVMSVLDSSQYIGGSVVSAFSSHLAHYLNVRHVIPCANGTDALQIAFMSLGLKQGDEVILPSFTYIATAEAALLLGLKPVFLEVRRDDFCIDVAQIEQAITKKTKAIVAIHLFGHASNMDTLSCLAKNYGLYLVEDNAQSIGCQYKTKFTGSIGDIGTLSFFPSKNLGAYGDGGAVITNDDLLAKRIRQIVNHGQSRQYYHDILGCNSRLDALQAAVLNVKLQYLNEYTAARRAVAHTYNDFFDQHPAIETPTTQSYSSHVYHQYTLKLVGVNRDSIVNHMKKRGIPCMVYYPVPCHQQKMFERQTHHTSQPLTTTEELSKCVISLPIHTEMDTAQVSFIAEQFVDIVNQVA